MVPTKRFDFPSSGGVESRKVLYVQFFSINNSNLKLRLPLIHIPVGRGDGALPMY